MRRRSLVVAALLAVAVSAGAGTVARVTGHVPRSLPRSAPSSTNVDPCRSAKDAVQAEFDALHQLGVVEGTNTEASNIVRVWAQILSDNPSCFEAGLVAKARLYLVNTAPR